MKLFMITIEDCYGYDTETEHHFFINEKLARKVYQEQVDLAKLALADTNAHVLNDDTATEEERDAIADEVSYLYSEQKCSFNWWLDGDYDDEHFLISIEEIRTED